MERKHNFLPNYLTVPSCPMQISESITAALIDLARHPHDSAARLVWISPPDSRINDAIIVEVLPNLNMVRFSGITGCHSVQFVTLTDLPRAIEHGAGFEKACRFKLIPCHSSRADWSRALKMIQDGADALARAKAAEDDF